MKFECFNLLWSNKLKNLASHMVTVKFIVKNGRLLEYLKSFCHITEIAVLRDDWCTETSLVVDELPMKFLKVQIVFIWQCYVTKPFICLINYWTEFNFAHI